MSMNKEQYKYIVDNDGNMIERSKVSVYDTEGVGVCGDCGATQLEYHYVNCDMERCPVCNRQLLTCECWSAYMNGEEQYERN